MEWYTDLADGGAGTTLFLLLVAAHCLEDFVFLYRKRAAEQSRSLRALGRQAAEHASVQVLVLVPAIARDTQTMLTALTVSCSVGLVHVLIDLAKLHWEWRKERQLLSFACDQVLRLATSALVAGWWLRDWPLPTEEVWVIEHDWLQRAALVAATYAFAGNGGSAIVVAVLNRLRAPGQSDAEASGDQCAPGAGQLIGVLERLIVATLVWHGEWAAVGFVLTAKSVARFKELEKQPFAEYYLVGTLTSFLVACGLGALLSRFV